MPLSSAPLPSVGSVCPDHPDHPSVSICSRCGRFLCSACEALQDPPACAPCASLLSDPLGVVSQPFSVMGALANGWKMFAATIWITGPVALLFGIPGGLLSWAIESEGGSMRTVLQADRLYTATIGLIGVGAMLAAMVRAAERGRSSLGSCLGQGLTAWPRMFGARFRAGLWILLFTLLLIIPGLIKAVTLALVTQAAFREPGKDALATSTLLSTGRRWHLLGLFILAYVPMVVAGLTVGVIGGLVADAYPETTAAVDVLIDATARLGEGFVIAVGLAAFYGLKQAVGDELEPRPAD